MKSLKKVYEKKKVLITGGLGFMGSNLAHRLVDLGSNIIILNRNRYSPPYGANLHNIKDIRNKLRLKIEDIRNEQIKEFIVGQEIIFHLAGQVGHYNGRDPLFQTYVEDAKSINVDGTLNILSLCKKFNPDARIIFAGSSFQYGKPQYVPVDENHPLKPDENNLYAISKNQADGLLENYHEEFGLDTVRLRIANPYGPRAQMRHPNYGFLNWFIRRAMDNQSIEIYGGGNQKKDMIYIDDLTNAFLMVGADKRTNGESFNVGSGRWHSIKALAEIVINAVGNGEIKLVGDSGTPEKYKKIGMPNYISDISKIQSMTDWSPSTDIITGIERTVEFYRENRMYYW